MQHVLFLLSNRAWTPNPLTNQASLLQVILVIQYIIYLTNIYKNMYKNTSSLPSKSPQNILKGSDNMAIKYTCKIALMQELGLCYDKHVLIQILKEAIL